VNTPQTYGTGRYTSKYPFIAMQVGEVFTFNRARHLGLARTAYKYAERVRERTGEPFGLQLTTKTVGESRITTVTRIE